MLEKIREGAQGPAAKIILGLVILSFALAGIGGYLGQTTEPSVAEVNGVKITQTQFARALENERARLQQQYGDMFEQIANDPTYMAQIRQSVTQRLIQQELQSQLAAELGLRVSDQEVRQTILELPAFQLGGQFSNDRYLQVIRQMGYQADGFREYLREEMTRSQLIDAIAGSEFVLDEELVRAAGLQQQQRAVEYVVLENAQFAEQQNVTDEQIQEYYELNQSQFLSPEQVSVQYVELNADDIQLDEPVTEQEIADYYEQNKAFYVEPEQRRVSHILISSEAGDSEAQEKAQALLAELKEGADFAELAQTESDDLVSAEIGGDLDWIERDMLDPEFEDAAFALNNVGDLSPVVQSEFGYHIIKLTELQPGKTKPLADVQDDIRAELESVKKADLFYGKQTELAELAFEIADTLEDAAQAVGAEVQSTGLVSRNALPAPLNQPNVAATIFSAELLEDRVNSDLIELDSEHVIVVRVAEHKRAATKELSEVSAQIKTQLVNEQATAAAKEQAQTYLTQLQSGQSLSELAQAQSLEVTQESAVTRRSFNVEPAIVEQVFKLPHPQEKPVFDVVSLNNGDVAIVALTGVNTPTNTEMPEQVKQSLTMMLANNSYETFLSALEAQAEVVRKQSQLQE